jgi:RNA polymerase sigma-70 factor (ECF subfamily)
MNEDLEPIVERCRDGDELAWEALVRRLQGRVYALALHYVRSPEEARDVAQEVFIRVWRGLPNFERTGSFVPWLLKITRTCSIDHVRRRKARPPVEDLIAEDLPTLSDPSLRPDEQAELESRRSLVHRALRQIGEMHREILQLQEIQELPLNEVARILGIPEGTAKSRASRARAELARVVVRLEGSPEAG